MFFPELIKSIKSSDLVLEIGPGSDPHPRSNIFLEKNFPNQEIAYKQRGYAENKADDEKIIYYDGGKFPFKDKEFDYVICSHVIEHIPVDELSLFISELQRIAPRGYLEFPNIYYELICYPDVHIWFMNYRDNTIYFLNKTLFTSNYLHRIYREMFYGSDHYLYDSFSRYKDFYFCGFEWEENINFEEVLTYDELINEDDYEKVRYYFANFKAPNLDSDVNLIDLSLKNKIKSSLSPFVYYARKINNKVRKLVNIYLK
jgi:predicted SAM-dependent methyltransferase